MKLKQHSTLLVLVTGRTIFDTTRKKRMKKAYPPILLLLNCFVDFIDFLCKHVKLRDDEFLSEGLDQQDDVSPDTPERKEQHDALRRPD